ncbi:hypothetical protein K449DRAFT_438467 [Hypoxylon sp. EC38]|nr:hypothetical protein K449DRAFT_438467 [Hypoxylon sp. EC38]
MDQNSRLNPRWAWYGTPIGVIPNFDNPENRNSVAVAIFATYISLAVPTALGRVHSRLFLGGHIMMVLHILLYSFGIIAAIIACIPLATIWEPWLQGKCINKKALGVTTACFNVAMDLFYTGARIKPRCN